MFGNMLKRFDDFLLGKFQWLSDKIFDFFGIGNFQIAKLVMGIYCGLLTWDCFINLSIYKLLNSSIGWLLFHFMGILILFFWWKGIITFTEKLTNNTPEGFVSSSIFLLMFLRNYKTLILLLYLPSFIKAINIIGDDTWPLNIHYFWMSHLCDYLERITSFIILYFVSCKPKPPQRSKVREYIDKYTLVRKLAFHN